MIKYFSISHFSSYLTATMFLQLLTSARAIPPPLEPEVGIFKKKDLKKRERKHTFDQEQK